MAISRRVLLHGASAERVARYSGSTHQLCEYCGNVKPTKRLREEWGAAEKREWDGNPDFSHSGAVYSESRNEYFLTLEDVVDFCEGNESVCESLCLYHCEPAYATPIDSSIWHADLAEDCEGELPDELQQAMDAFNAAVKACAVPLSYQPSAVAAVITPKVMAEWELEWNHEHE